MDVKELLSFKPDATPGRDPAAAPSQPRPQVTERGRKRLAVPTNTSGAPGVEGGILKRPNLSSTNSSNNGDVTSTTMKRGKEDGNSLSSGLEISEEERQRILQMVENEPEGTLLDETVLKRMVNVLEKRIGKNQEMRIKFPDEPGKFMDSELELHESLQELHALATVPSLYGLAVDLDLPSTLLGCLAHENGDISTAVLNLLQELTDLDDEGGDEEGEETSSFIDALLEKGALTLLTQNLDRLDEAANKDEADGVHNTLAIFENLFELRPELGKEAGKNGLLSWLLKRARSRLPFDPNKLYVGEILAILLQGTEENQIALGEGDGIDTLLQQLAIYKRHDPQSNEEAEYMENLFNTLCSALLYGPNREKFLKGEGPQLMNLMLREKKQSRSGALKVLSHCVSGPQGTSNANKIVEILGLRTIFPLFMRTPKKGQRKGMSGTEVEEHVLSILTGILQHVVGPTRNRLLLKFQENDFEKVERLGELHFKYLKKVEKVDAEIVEELKKGGEAPDEDEVYLRRLDSGLFTLQLLDYLILDIATSDKKVKERLGKIIQLRKGSLDTIKDIVREYGDNLGEEDKDWKRKINENINNMLEEF